MYKHQLALVLMVISLSLALSGVGNVHSKINDLMVNHLYKEKTKSTQSLDLISQADPDTWLLSALLREIPCYILPETSI
jgi:hypothetical protein